MEGKSARLLVIPQQKQICHYRHTRKTGELFLLFNTGVDFSLRNNSANSGSFAKVSVPVHIYNSLYRHRFFYELSDPIYNVIPLFKRESS